MKRAMTASILVLSNTLKIILKKEPNEVKSIITAAFRRATEILEENKDKVELMSQMLVEFETLDNQDVQEIIDGKWNVEEKRERLTKASELHKKEPVTPPPPPAKDEEKETPPENVQPTPNPVA